MRLKMVQGSSTLTAIVTPAMSVPNTTISIDILRVEMPCAYLNTLRYLILRVNLGILKKISCNVPNGQTDEQQIRPKRKVTTIHKRTVVTDMSNIAGINCIRSIHPKSIEKTAPIPAAKADEIISNATETIMRRYFRYFCKRQVRIYNLDFIHFLVNREIIGEVIVKIDRIFIIPF